MYATAPNGELTVGCYNGRDLKTYDQSGSVVRQIDSTQIIDGIENCIMYPVVDQDGVLYGRPSNGLTSFGPNMLAYDGSTLRWKYPVTCSPTYDGPNIAVGADGIVYVLSLPQGSLETRLIGLDPVLDPGQSQPTVVMDTEVLVGCDARIYPYDGGVALYEYGTHSTKFYSESGVYLGEASDTGYSHAVSPDGMLFTHSEQDHSTLDAYHPNGQKEWDVSVDGSINSIHPLPNGDVGLLLSGPGGTDVFEVVSSEGYIKDYTTVSMTVDGIDYSWPRAVVNNDGSIYVFQGGFQPTSYDGMMLILKISPSLRILEQRVESREFFADQPEAVKIAGNRVFFQEYGTQHPSETLSTLTIDGIGFDYPRSDIFGVSESLKYVAMGDSYSSGEGNPVFVPATDIDGTNECHRSIEDAYLTLLAGDANLGLGLSDFVACSGATINDILGISESDGGVGRWNEPKQIDALSEDTDVVTITIGGNDIGFADYATACSLSLCDFSTSIYSDTQDKIANILPGRLEDLFEAIDDKTSQNVDVYIVGYPYITPSPMPTGPNSACWPFNGGTNDPDPSLNNGAAAHQIVSDLNSTIDDAVVSYGSAKFSFVDPTLAGSPFEGHDWCR